MPKKTEHIDAGRRRLSTKVNQPLRALLTMPLVLGAVAAFAQTPLPTTWRYDALSGSQAAVYTPDGQKLILSGSEGVQILDATTGAPIRCIQVDGTGSWTLAVSPDGKTLATTSAFSSTGSLLETWDISTGKHLATYPTNAKVGLSSIAFSPDGKTLVDGGTTLNSFSHTRQGIIEEWDVATGNSLGTLTTTSIQTLGVAFSKDGSTLAATGASSPPAGAVVEVWNALTNQLTQRFKSADATPSSISLAPDGKTVILGGSGQGSRSGVAVLELWNATSGALISQLSTTNSYIQTVQYSPDGTMLVDAGGGSDVEVRDASGNLVTTVEGSPIANAATFSPDGKSVLVYGAATFTSAGPAGLCQQFSVPKGVLTAVFNPAAFISQSTAFSPDGKRLVTGGFAAPAGSAAFTGAVTFWDAVTGVPMPAPASSLVNGVNSAVFSADGTLVVDGGSMPDPSMSFLVGAVEIRNGATGEILQTLPSAARQGASVQVAISPDAKTVAVGSSTLDGTATSGVLELWNVSTGQLISRLATNIRYVHGLAFSPDGKTLGAIGSSGNAVSALELWTVSTRQLAKTLADASSVNLTCLAFSPDGKKIAEAGSASSGVLDVWDIATARSTGNLCPANSPNISSLAYSRDGKTILANTSTVVEIFSASSPGLIGSYLSRQTFGFNSGLAMSPDGLRIACVSRSLLVAPNPLAGAVPPSNVSVAPVTVVGGTSATGTVTLTQAAPVGGAFVNLASADARVTVPNFVLVPAGASTATFPVHTVPVAANTSITISAIADGVTVTSSVMVTSPIPTSLTLNPATVFGGINSIGTLILNGPAGPGGVTITLTSDLASATVPGFIRILPGGTSGTFRIATQPVTTDSTATIVGTVGSHTKASTLTVSAAVVRSISVAPRNLQGGLDTVGTVALTSAAPAGGVTVTLMSSDPTVASVPATILVPAGATSVTFTVSTFKLVKTKVVTLTATLGVVKTTALAVTP